MASGDAPSQRPEGSAAGGCATHPERAAEGTCSRCGDNLCAECVAGAEGGLCARCQELLANRGKLAHVDWLAVTTMVHGSLFVGYAVVMIFMGGWLGLSGTFLPADADPEAAALTRGILVLIPALMMLAHLIPGVLQLVAGYFMLRFRMRWLALLSYLAGGLSVFGCYCVPTALGIGIWGLIVLFDRDVVARFEAVAREREQAASASG